MRAWTRTAWTRIGVAGWSPTENGSIASGDPRLVAWPPAESGPRFVSGRLSPVPPATLLESGTRWGLRRGSGAHVWSGTRVRSGTRSGPGPGPVWDPVRTSRGVRAPTRASVDDRSRSRLRDHHSSSSRSSDSDEGRRTFQPRAASAEHPLATVCNKLLQSMGALRADNTTLSERLGALERRSSVADPTPLPSTPRLREEEGEAAFEDELSLEAPGDSFSEEELPRDWLPRATEPMSLEVPRQHTDDTSVVLTTSANPTSEVQPSADEPEWRRYRETLRAVYRYHPFIPLPEAPVDETFGGALSALCQGQVREDRYSSLPQSGALTNALRHVNGVVRGIVHSLLEAADRVRYDAQKWGTHLSLPSPPIRQYRQEYYRMHYPVLLLEEERLLPHTPWSTSAASSVLKRGAPAEVKVRVSQMKD